MTIFGAVTTAWTLASCSPSQSPSATQSGANVTAPSQAPSPTPNSSLRTAGILSSATRIPLNQKWSQIFEQTSCEGNPDQCLGGYGFTIENDGHFVIGPNFQNFTIEGGLTTLELANFSAAANAVLSDDLTLPEQCTSPHPSFLPHPSLLPHPSPTPSTGSNASDRLIAVDLAGEKTQVDETTQDTERQCIIGDPTHVNALHALMTQLLTKYYPKQFPTISSACATATQKVVADYVQAQSCSDDSDCGYIDGFYNTISRGSTNEFVTTFNCATVTPFLVVANLKHVQDSLTTLQADKNAQFQACASAQGAISCKALGGFTTAFQPICDAGVCKQIFH